MVLTKLRTKPLSTSYDVNTRGSHLSVKRPRDLGPALSWMISFGYDIFLQQKFQCDWWFCGWEAYIPSNVKMLRGDTNRKCYRSYMIDFISISCTRSVILNHAAKKSINFPQVDNINKFLLCPIYLPHRSRSYMPPPPPPPPPPPYWRQAIQVNFWVNIIAYWLQFYLLPKSKPVLIQIMSALLQQHLHFPLNTCFQ